MDKIDISDIFADDARKYVKNNLATVRNYILYMHTQCSFSSKNFKNCCYACASFFYDCLYILLYMYICERGYIHTLQQ